MTTIVRLATNPPHRPASTPAQSARARKRQRQKNNQKLRVDTALDESLRTLNGYSSVANGLRAWLAYLQRNGSAQDHRSATNFSRVFQNEIARSSRNPAMCEMQSITVDFLTFAIHEFVGSFIVEKNIEKPSKIARIGSNMCSFVFFLGKYNVLPLSEVQKLHDYCSELGANMLRSVRAERVGEAYATYVREAYDNAEMTENVENVSLFHGGFEVAHVGKRFCLLQDWSESDLNHSAFRNIDPVKVRFPVPMTRQLRPGDHLHLEIRKLRGSSIWVPTECYGVYPEGADDEPGPSLTPTGRTDAERKMNGDVEDITELLQKYTDPLYAAHERLKARGEVNDSLTQSMARLDLTLSDVRKGFAWKRNFSQRCRDDLSPDGFDESRFSDFYFGSMEVDIGDNDKGFGTHEEGSDDNFSDGEETE